ncbi:MAG: hypothetical protein QG591_961 [Planctomycetota bacterium]|nr:hypothetical protein [Planctomycetota bacterium]
MFIGKCDIQNISSRGAVYETQKQYVAPMEIFVVSFKALLLHLVK